VDLVIDRSLVTYWQADDLKPPSLILRIVHIYAACVIFGHGDYHFSCRGKFVLLQGEIFVGMSCSHYIDMFHTHFKHSCHEGFCIKQSMFYMLWMVYVV